MTPTQLAAALKTNFPALDEAIANLPPVTNGWNDIPGLANLTRVDGAPVKSVPQLRTYFRSDLIPASGPTAKALIRPPRSTRSPRCC